MVIALQPLGASHIERADFLLPGHDAVVIIDARGTADKLDERDEHKVGVGN